jgi:hypothetical protein
LCFHRLFSLLLRLHFYPSSRGCSLSSERKSTQTLTHEAIVAAILTERRSFFHSLPTPFRLRDPSPSWHTLTYLLHSGSCAHKADSDLCAQCVKDIRRNSKDKASDPIPSLRKHIATSSLSKDTIISRTEMCGERAHIPSYLDGHYFISQKYRAF